MNTRTEQGWYAGRFTGSKGPGSSDVICWRDGVRELHQLKAGKNPLGGFGPAARKNLVTAAESLGATPYLTWWRRGFHSEVVQ